MENYKFEYIYHKPKRNENKLIVQVKKARKHVSE